MKLAVTFLVSMILSLQGGLAAPNRIICGSDNPTYVNFDDQNYVLEPQQFPMPNANFQRYHLQNAIPRASIAQAYVQIDFIEGFYPANTVRATFNNANQPIAAFTGSTRTDGRTRGNYGLVVVTVEPYPLIGPINNVNRLTDGHLANALGQAAIHLLDGQFDKYATGGRKLLGVNQAGH